MTARRRGVAGLVYSTELGRTCPVCRRSLAECRCDAEITPAGDGEVRVRRETSGRKGAGVTIITGLPLAKSELVKLARELKQRCGSGGTVKDGRVEIQGDHRETLVVELTKRGYRISSPRTVP